MHLLNPAEDEEGENAEPNIINRSREEEFSMSVSFDYDYNDDRDYENEHTIRDAIINERIERLKENPMDDSERPML